jgi:hypothetical protein
MDYINDHIEYKKMCEKYCEEAIWQEPPHANAQGYIEGDRKITHKDYPKRLRSYGRRKSNEENERSKRI